MFAQAEKSEFSIGERARSGWLRFEISFVVSCMSLSPNRFGASEKRFE
jgi:hypothetical protein